MKKFIDDMNRLVCAAIPRKLNGAILFATARNPEFPWSYLYSLGDIFPSAVELAVNAALITYPMSGYTLIRTTQPIPLHLQFEKSLQPVGKSIGQSLLDLSALTGHPVELIRRCNDMVFVAVVHASAKIPGLFQLSFFDCGGPIGDWSEKEPVSLVFEAYTAGYREFAPGTLDAMACHFESELLAKMTA